MKKTDIHLKWIRKYLILIFFFVFHDAVFDLLAVHPESGAHSFPFSGNLLLW